MTRRVVAIHFLADRFPTDRKRVTMACGLFGREAWSGEFETLDGREARLEFSERSQDVTCRRCLARLAKAR